MTSEEQKFHRRADAEIDLMERIYHWWAENCPSNTDAHLAVMLGEEFGIDVNSVKNALARNVAGELDRDEMLMEFVQLAL